MKKIKFLLAALLLTITVSAQTYDQRLNLTTGITTALIQPFQLSVLDTVMAYGLGVQAVGNNFSTQCMLMYQLVDSSGNVLYRNNMTIGGADYINWTGGNNYPFTYVASKLKLTLK